MRRVFLASAAIIAGFWAGWVAHSRLATVEVRHLYYAATQPTQETHPAASSPGTFSSAENRQDKTPKEQAAVTQTGKESSPAKTEAVPSLEIQTTSADSSEISAANDVRSAIAQLNSLDDPELLNQIFMGIDSLPDNAQREELLAYLDKTIASLKQNSPQQAQPAYIQNEASAAVQEPAPVTYRGIFQSIHALDPSATDRDDRVWQLVISIHQLPDTQQQQELLNDLARQLQP